MKREVKLYGVMRNMLVAMLADIEEQQMFETPAGGGNSPAWILGHLTVVNQLGLSLLGKETPSGQLLTLFGPGSKSEFDQQQAPSISELKTEFSRSADALSKAASEATEEALDASREGQILADILPTVGDMLGHILTTHFSLHTGQLSAWRRARGLPSILKI